MPRKIINHYFYFKVGELIMTTNDVNARSDRVKTGRMELLMKMFTGYTEPENVLDALEGLEALNKAHNSMEKVSFSCLFLNKLNTEVFDILNCVRLLTLQMLLIVKLIMYTDNIFYHGVKDLLEFISQPSL